MKRVWSAVPVAVCLLSGRPPCAGRPEGLHYTPPGAGLQTSDLSRLRAIGDVHLSPDGTRVAYSIVNNDRPGRPYSQVTME